MIRKATLSDISRISEIIVFAKRMAYRLLLNDDIMEFNKLQVLDIAEGLKAPDALDGIYVFDDGIVKGMIKRKIFTEGDVPGRAIISDFYVDPFFQQNGIGTELMETVLCEARESGCDDVILYVYKENENAVTFYESFGFEPAGKTITDKRTGKQLTGYVKNL